MNRHHARPDKAGGRPFPRRALFALGPACVGAVFMVSLALAQNTSRLGLIEDWKIVEYHDASQKTPAPGTRQVKTVLAGAQAQPLPDGAVRVFKMRLENYKVNGTTNLLAASPECVTHPRRQTVWSEQNLSVTTAEGQLSIQGRGFYCTYSNVVLVISNEVETTIHRRLLSKSSPPQLAAPGSTNTEAMKIHSDFFTFNQASNRIVYAGRVRVLDPQLKLACDRLTISLDTNGTIQVILAQSNVVLSAQDSPSQARGHEATYHLNDNPDLEYVELKGSPATWSDGLRQGQGPLYLYRPQSGQMIAPRPSRVQLPRADLMQLQARPGSTNGSPTMPADAPRRPVEITADYMNFQLQPATNTPSAQAGRTLLASNQVVVTSSSDQSEARGQLATFDGKTGLFELTGQAVWKTRDRLVQADTLQFDSTNRIFRALENSYLKVPVAMMGDSPMVTDWLGSVPDSSAARAPYLEIHSRQMEYRPGHLQFQDAVKAALTAGPSTVGRLSCGRLTVRSNRLGQLVMAERDVFLEQAPVRNSRSNLVTKSLRSAYATVQVGTNGLVQTMRAQTNAVLSQTEQPPAPGIAPLLTEIRAETITASFAGHTNQLESVLAEEKVLITHTSGRARADRAVYSRERDTLELIGNVTLESGQGRLISAPAAVLRHFGLWPGPFNRLTLPARTRDRSPQQPGPGPALKPSLP